MELSPARWGPVTAVRTLRGRVGRALRRLQDRARLAVPTENTLLGDLGGRYGTFDEFLAASRRDVAVPPFLGDLPRDAAAA